MRLLFEAQQNACPPEVAQAQAALKGAQASLQGGQITRSLAGARTQEVNAPRTQEVNAPLHTSSGDPGGVIPRVGTRRYRLASRESRLPPDHHGFQVTRLPT